jgi:hypothetical protein
MHDYRWMPSLKIHLNAMRDEIDFMPEIMVDFLKTDRLDLEMLKDYISIVININRKENGHVKSINYPMKYCTEKMFTDHNIIPPPKDIENKRLCPDIEHEDKNYKVLGSLKDENNQHSVSIQIR